MNIEKIQEFNREKIIMACNPDCENYDEALEKEYMNSNECIVSYRYEISPFIKAGETLTSSLSKIDKLEKDLTIVFREVEKCFGLPLTFSRVFIGLSMYSKKSIYFNGNFFERISGKEDGEYFIDYKWLGMNWEFFNKDGTDTVSENQPENTQRIIYKLLGGIK